MRSVSFPIVLLLFSCGGAEEPLQDAGIRDATEPDRRSPDATEPDAAEEDAQGIDAHFDAAVDLDAGTSDLGGNDARPVDPLLLGHVERAADWVAAVAEQEGNTIFWPEVIGEPAWTGAVAHPLNLYDGVAGAGLFFLKLSQVSGAVGHEQLAIAAADRLVETATPALGGYYWEHEVELNDGTIITYDSEGLYNGAAGVGLFLLRMGEALNEPSYSAMAEGAGIWIMATAYDEPNGCSWLYGSTDIISGNAGILLFLLELYWATGDSSYLDGATCAGDWLVDVATEEGDKMSWPSSEGGPRTYTGLSHGVAGVAYALAVLSEASHDTAYLDAARAGARWLIEEATCDQEGCRWYHYQPDGLTTFQTGWCHGVAGTTRLFLLLHRITNDASYLQLAERAATWAMRVADPNLASPDFWGLSLCCGAASVGEFFLDLYHHTKRPTYLAFARSIAQYLLAEAHTDSSGTRWTNYNYPDTTGRIWYPPGLKVGASGVAWFLLRTALAESDTRDWPMLLDERL